jgi:catalase
MHSPSRAGAFAGFSLASALCLQAIPGLALAQEVTPAAQVDALEAIFGTHAGARRSGAKGVCASGHFVGNAVGRSLSSASAFSGAKVPVVARFSVGGGNPMASDKGRSVRGLSVWFKLPRGEQWMMANVSAPVFFVARPDQFAAFLLARVNDPSTGKPDATRLKAFNEANPETLRQAAYLAGAPVPASYAAARYWGVNAFELINAKGQSRFVRWEFVPTGGEEGLSEDQLRTAPDHFLIDELRQRVARGPVTFDFKLQLAEAGDNLIDPTQAWPASRVTVPAGRLVIDQVAPSAGGACEDITFNPLVLPQGVRPSADPVLRARAPAYGVALGRRLGEARGRR